MTEIPYLSTAYVPPSVRRGDWLDDEIHGNVEVGGYSNGRIPWPKRKKTGVQSLILCGALVDAVRHESVLAITYWFGVSATTAWKWRVVLGVDRTNNPGTKKLHRDLISTKLTPERAALGRERAATPEAREKNAAAHRGKPMPATTRAALLEAVSRPKPPEFGKRAHVWLLAGKKAKGLI
jgi:hypothetical protein